MNPVEHEALLFASPSPVCLFQPREGGLSIAFIDVSCFHTPL